MKHDGGWKKESSRYLFKSQWFNLRQDDVELPAGESIVYTLIEHPGYSMVVPLLDDGRVILERVYRYTVQETVPECPSGSLDGDTPIVAAERELLEETGWSAGVLTSLGSYYGSNGINNERFHIFLGTRLQNISEPNRELAEQMELEKMRLKDAVELAYSGQLADGPSALALMLAFRHVQQSV